MDSAMRFLQKAFFHYKSILSGATMRCPTGWNDEVDATAQLGLWDVGLWWPTDTEMAFESQK